MRGNGDNMAAVGRCRHVGVGDTGGDTAGWQLAFMFYLLTYVGAVFNGVTLLGVGMVWGHGGVGGCGDGGDKGDMGGGGGGGGMGR